MSSWISKNYEKVVLGGAVAAALGLAYLGWSRLSTVDEEFVNDLKGSGSNATAVRDADLVTKAIVSLKLNREWKQAIVDDRPVDLFTGVPLFVSAAAPDTTVDLVKKDSAPVHPPIPNIWWLENRLDPGYGDSPSRDPDGDGFSNLEEYEAGTDPNNSKVFPSLIEKLMYVKDESLGWVLLPTYGSDGKFPIKYEDTTRATNKSDAANLIGPGDTFFLKGPMKDRFKFLGSEVRKEMNRAINMEQDVTILRIEDQRPNKKGTVYEFPSPLNDQRKNQFLKYDRTAVFSLEALGMGGKEFKVEENTTFSLPPGGAKKDYLLKSVTPAGVVVEKIGGGQPVEIKKGAMAGK